jgi:hypothetical protein
VSITSRWKKARLRFYEARIRHLIGDEKWAAALTAVIDFAQWAHGRIDDTQLWVDMTVSATEIVAHLDDPGEYRAFLAHFADPFLGDETQPRIELLEAFADIADDVDPMVMIAIGRWLTDARTMWPLGPYLMGHFSELTSRNAGDRPPVASIAGHFRMAATRAEKSGLTAWYHHARLREGALYLTTGADRRRGRQILGELDWTRLSPEEQLWMGVALAASVQWTDRLRAMDIVLDLHRAIDQVRPGYQSVRIRDLRRAAATIFKLADLHLPEPENRRQQELSETLFADEEREEWQAFLDARRELATLANLSLDKSDQALSLLDQLSESHRRRWQPAADALRILSAGRSGEYAGTGSAPSPRRHSHRIPIVDHVAALLSALSDDDDHRGETIVERLKKLNDLLADAPQDPAALRPIALFWPGLLESRELLDDEELRQELTRLADLYAATAPPPSFGWWALAAHFYDADLPAPARHFAQRALAAGPAEDESTGRFVAQNAFSQALDDQDARDARRWIDVL